MNEFYRQAVAFAPRALSGVLIFFCFWIGTLVLKTLIRHLGRRTRLNYNLIRLLSQTGEITLLIVGAVTALGTVGVHVGAMITGLGLSGFALGFALRDALSNVLAGVSILLYRPFVVGDRISVTGMEGTVVEIDLRYTVLDAGDRRILIPNSTLFTNSVVILSVSQPARHQEAVGWHGWHKG